MTATRAASVTSFSTWIPAGAVEAPVPRWQALGTAAPVATVVYVSRAALAVKSYTTVTLIKGATQGSGLANSYLGVYDVATSARRAVSADISTPLAAVLANVAGTFTLNFTPSAAGDYWLALLVGSASAMPTFYRMNWPQNAHAILAPQASGQATGGTVLPDPISVVPTNAGQGIWMRYE